MPKSRIVYLDAGSGQPLPLAPDSSVVLTSADAWRNVAVERQRYPPTETPDGARLPWHLFSVQLGAPAVLEARRDGLTRRLRRTPGDVFFLSAGAPADFSWREESENLNVGLDPGFVSRIALETLGSNRVEPEDFRLGSDPGALNLAFLLEGELKTGGLGGELYAESLATALAVRLLRGYSSTGRAAAPPDDRVRRGLPGPALGRVLDYVGDNLPGRLTLREMAGVAGMSRHHFARLFKESTGLSPHRYVLRRRVERARELLALTDLSLDDVARSSGFSHQSHMAYHVKRLLGVTPSALRGR